MTSTVGADPEFFLMRDDNIIPATGLIGGTKNKPLKIEGLPKGFFVQEDNVMVEINIPPARDPSLFVDSIGAAKKSLLKNLGKGFELSDKSTFEFKARDLDFEKAKQFGCSPDLNAYTMGNKNNLITEEEMENKRCCGGHIHLGFENTNNIPKFVVAAFCDLFLAAPSVSVDKQGFRRQNYGQAGNYRDTSYGIEYRTLSNYWAVDMEYCYDIAYRVHNLLEFITSRSKEQISFMYKELPWTEIRSCINEENEILAADIIAYGKKVLKIWELNI